MNAKRLKYQMSIPAMTLLILFSCTSIPKESVDMSAKLDRQILALQQANVGLITQVYADKTRQMTEYPDSVWFPTYLTRWVVTGVVLCVICVILSVVCSIHLRNTSR